MSVMHFIDEEDNIHLELIEKFGGGAYVTREKAINTFEAEGFKVSVDNSFKAAIKPTPVGEILEGGSIDGFPVQDTEVEFAVIVSKK